MKQGNLQEAIPGKPTTLPVTELVITILPDFCAFNVGVNARCPETELEPPKESSNRLLTHHDPELRLDVQFLNPIPKLVCCILRGQELKIGGPEVRPQAHEPQ